jgi:hypothetical protein
VVSTRPPPGKTKSPEGLVLLRLVATDDALGADPIVDVRLEAPTLAQRHGLQLGGELNHAAWALRTEQVAPAADDEPGYIRHDCRIIGADQRAPVRRIAGRSGAAEPRESEGISRTVT